VSDLGQHCLQLLDQGRVPTDQCFDLGCLAFVQSRDVLKDLDLVFNETQIVRHGPAGSAHTLPSGNHLAREDNSLVGLLWCHGLIINQTDAEGK
jgi:hypothetical protein